jgi:hypothetical protein
VLTTTRFFPEGDDVTSFVAPDEIGIMTIIWENLEHQDFN